MTLISDSVVVEIIVEIIVWFKVAVMDYLLKCFALVHLHHLKLVMDTFCELL